MAYQITGTGQNITGAAPVGNYPFTLHAIINPNLQTANAFGVFLGDSTQGNNNVQLVLQGSAAPSYPARITANSGPGFVAASSTAPFSINTWNYVTGIGAASNSRTIYLNGGNSATNTADRPLARDFDTLRLSNTNVTATVLNAEIAIWDTTLTADEIISLAKGFKPLRIRPQNLVFYSPLVRDFIDVVGAIALTQNGGSVSDHPRVY
jgi:hypothetical protein